MNKSDARRARRALAQAQHDMDRADKATVRATLRSEGVAILADDCVVSSDGMDFL